MKKNLYFIIIFFIVCIFNITADFKVEYGCRNNEMLTGTITFTIILRNIGPEPVSYDGLSLKYYYTKDGIEPEEVYIVNNGINGIQIFSGYTLEQDYIRINFKDTGELIQVGYRSCTIPVRINKFNYGFYNQSDDYSFEPTDLFNYIDNHRITLYRNDILIWGEEPSYSLTYAPSPTPTTSGTPAGTPKPTNTPSPTEVPEPSVTPINEPHPLGYTLYVQSDGIPDSTKVKYFGDIEGIGRTDFNINSNDLFSVQLKPMEIDIQTGYTEGYYLWIWDENSCFKYNDTAWKNPVENVVFDDYSIIEKRKIMRYGSYSGINPYSPAEPTCESLPMSTPPPSFEIHYNIVDAFTEELIPVSGLNIKLIDYNTFVTITEWQDNIINSDYVSGYDFDESLNMLLIIEAENYHNLVIHPPYVPDVSKPLQIKLYPLSYATPAPENTPVRPQNTPPAPTPKGNWYYVNEYSNPEIEVTNDGNTHLTVKLTFKTAGIRIIDWGDIVFDENNLIANIMPIRWDGPVAPWETTFSHTYNLGELTAGDTYNFDLKLWDMSVETIPFTIPDISSTLTFPGEIYTDPSFKVSFDSSSGQTKAIVTALVIEDNNTAYKIASWGIVNKTGNEIIVNPSIMQNTEMNNSEGIYYLSTTYDLGILIPGTYSFKIIIEGIEVLSTVIEAVLEPSPKPTIPPLLLPVPPTIPIVTFSVSESSIEYPENTFQITLNNTGASCDYMNPGFFKDSCLKISPDYGSIGFNESVTLNVLVNWEELYGKQNMTCYNAVVVASNGVYRYIPWEIELINSNPNLLTISGTIDTVEGMSIMISGDINQTKLPESDGFYEFNQLKPGGNYSITVGYSPKPPEVTFLNIAEGDTISGIYDFNLNITSDVCSYNAEPSKIDYYPLTTNKLNQDFLVGQTSSCCIYVMLVTSQLQNIDSYWTDYVQYDPVYFMCNNVHTISLDTTQFYNGTYIYQVKATDVNDKTSIAEVTFNISNPITITPLPELGDVNNDSQINIIDALLIAQYYVGLNPPVFFPAAADVDCSGNIDIVDALLTAQFYVGLVNVFC